MGHELRRAVPRSAHATWSTPHERAHPVATLLAAEEGRLPALLPLRHRRMATDSSTFLRGATALMAADLAGLPRSGLRVVACGDAHLGNFGAVAAPEGAAVFDINDFDEAASAPFEWDLKRLATSLVLAGRTRDLPPRATRALSRRAAHAYRRQMDALADLPPLDAWRVRLDLERLVEDIADRDTRKRERQRLAEMVHESRHTYANLVSKSGTLRLPERPPTVFRIGPEEGFAHVAFDAYLDAVRPEQRALLDRYRLRDVAFKAAGIGSVGMFCAIGLFASGDGDVLLLQLKEARTSVLEAHAGPSPYAPGERVVSAQRTMQAAPDPLLGWTRAPIDGRSFYVRTLADPRLSAAWGRIEADALRFYALLCGRTLARAHARSGDAAMIAGYLGEGEAFDIAISEFAMTYADQVERDHATWGAAIKAGDVEVAP